MLDTELLSDIQLLLIEPPDGGLTWSSGLWSKDEVLTYLNQRQDSFLKTTSILLQRTSINTPPDVWRFDLPSDCIAVQRVVWLSATGAYRELPRSDGFSSDMYYNNWEFEQYPHPTVYTDGEVSPLELQVMPRTEQQGELQVLHTYTSTPCTALGVTLTVPEVFCEALLHGVLADMFNKSGRGQDVGRAAYCEQRFAEGIAAASLMVEGWA